DNFQKKKTSNIPSCIKDNENAKELFNIYNNSFSSPEGNPASKFIRNPNYGNLSSLKPGTMESKIVDRFQHVQDRNKNSNLLHAFIKKMEGYSRLFYDKGKLLSGDIKSAPAGNLLDDKSFIHCRASGSERCLSYKIADMEIKNEYPALFSQFSTGFNPETSLYSNLSSLVSTLAPDLSKSGKSEDYALFNFLKKSPISNVPKISEFLMEAQKASLNKKTDEKSKKLANIYNNINRTFRLIKKNMGKENNKRLHQVCPKQRREEYRESLPSKFAKLDIINNFFKNNRLEVQQAVIELSENPKDKAFIDSFFCQHQEQVSDQLAYNDTSSVKKLCKSTTQIPEGIKVKKVARTFNNPEMYSPVDYIIKPTKPPTIKYKMRVKVDEGMSLSDLDQWKQQIKDKVSGLFNCQAGSINMYSTDDGTKVPCNSNEKKTIAKFEIDIEEFKSGGKNDRPNFVLTKCYHAGVSEKLGCGKDLQKKITDDCIKRGSIGQLHPQKKGGDNLRDIETLFPTRNHFAPIGKSKSMTIADVCMESIERDSCTEFTGCEKTRCLWQECGRVNNDSQCFNSEMIKLYCERRFVSRREELYDKEGRGSDSSPLGLREPPSIEDLAWHRPNALVLPTTLPTQTISHEIAHQLGLEDEYFDAQAYDRPNLGEESSLMISGSQLSRRHFEKILAPLQCYQ
ncbi:MAG: hypothetical protein HOJ35_00425, partial [Bdellovibrionales bacterium]|nr:hypothetical protein [Bdellovibrionales bacterium]